MDFPVYTCDNMFYNNMCNVVVFIKHISFELVVYMCLNIITTDLDMKGGGAVEGGD